MKPVDRGIRHGVASANARIDDLLRSDSPVVVHEGGTIRVANEAAAKLLDAPSATWLETHSLDEFACTHPDVCTTDHGDACARSWHTALGQSIDIQTHELPFREGERELTVTVLVELTEHRLIRKTLSDKESRLRESQRLSQVGHWTLDLQSRELEWSEEIFRIFELDPETFEPSYAAFLAQVHPDDRAEVDRAYRESVDRRSTYEVVHRLLMPDGRIKFARERGRTFYAADGSAIRSIGTTQDVSADVERESQLRTAEHALASSCAGIAFADLDGTIRTVNPAFLALWRLDHADRVAGQRLRDLWCDPDANVGGFAEFETGSAAVGTRTARRSDGTTFTAEYVASVTRDSAGKPIGMLAHFLDVTDRSQSEATLRASEHRLKLVFENSSDMIGLVRIEGDRQIIEMVNERLLASLRQYRPEISARDVVGSDRNGLVGSLGLPAEDEAPVQRAILAAVSTCETQRLRATLSAFGRLLECTVVPVCDAASAVTRVLLTFHDITVEATAEDAMQNAQAMVLRSELLANTGSWERDLRTGRQQWSPGMYRVAGFNPEHDGTATPESLLARVHPEDRETATATMAAILRGDPPAHFESRILVPPGVERRVRGGFDVVRDASGSVTKVTGYVQDVTAHHAAAARIRAQLEEKEVLLREIHHRVKNNLQIVSSLLSLQQTSLDDARLADALDSTRGRIAAMALVHEALYSANDLASVDMGTYARELGVSLFSVFGAEPERLVFVVSEPSFRIELDRAIPCGLIVNELVTNALKHAFPEGRAGQIRVTFPCSEESFVIDVRDDGVGATPSTLARSSTLGLRLLPRLAAQLGGTLSWSHEAGTHARLAFPRIR